MKPESRHSLLVGLFAAAAVVTGCANDPPHGTNPETADTDDAVPVADTDSVDAGLDADIRPDGSDDGSESDVERDGGAPPINPGVPDIELTAVSGVTTEEVTYSVPGLDTERTLGLHIWYATDDVEGEPAMFVVSRDEFAWVDAAVSSPSAAAPAPLVVYSHGGRGFAGQISTVARQFVRNGWVFVGVPHPGDTLFDFDDDRSPAFPVIRAFDSMAAIDSIENLPEGHPLHGRVDTSKVLAMGHSFGGQNAWILAGLPLDLDRIGQQCGDRCTEADMAAYEAYAGEPRVVAAVSMESLIDANLTPDEGFAEMAAPILHMSGTESNDATELFDRASDANLTWVSLIGGCHESFTGTLVCPTLELDESLRTTATYAIAFATRHVLGSRDPGVLAILDGSIEVSSSAALMRSTRAE